MKRFLLDQKEPLRDSHLQTSWIQVKLLKEVSHAIVGFVGPLATKDTLDLSAIEELDPRTDFIHFVVTIPRVDSLQLLLIHRLLHQIAIDLSAPPKTRALDLLQDEPFHTLSYVSHSKNNSLAYLGISTEGRSFTAMPGASSAQDYLNNLADTILTAFSKEYNNLQHTADVLDEEQLKAD